MSARDDIFAGIRGALKRGMLPVAAEAQLAARVVAHRRNLVPARAKSLDQRARIDL
jgi:hypothetical protein